MMDDANDELLIRLLLANGLDECDDAVARIQTLKAERDRFAERHERHLILGAEVRARAEKGEAERDAARDAALEEAAKMVDVFFGQNAFADADLYKWGTASGAQAIAAAIRAMKGKSQ